MEERVWDSDSQIHSSLLGSETRDQGQGRSSQERALWGEGQDPYAGFLSAEVIREYTVSPQRASGWEGNEGGLWAEVAAPAQPPLSPCLSSDHPQPSLAQLPDIPAPCSQYLPPAFLPPMREGCWHSP